ncbi:MAG: iron-sulfur cluster assembly accessory protein [Elusimicrobia bacterium]|nr:iron-sulfur cluster assembly accessory protein [Elusimicrobiota bacterium]
MFQAGSAPRRALFDISARAAAQAKSLLASRPAPDRALRVKVTPGGCSGFNYNLEPWAGPAPDGDHRVDVDDLTVYVDRNSLLFLAGTVLDYESTLFSKRFVFKNPNAIASCSCGESFSVQPQGRRPPPEHFPLREKVDLAFGTPNSLRF